MLIIGPAGSGKTHACLERLEDAVRRKRGDRVRLVVPTAALAQQLLQRLARRGLTVPGDLVLSLDQLLIQLVPDARTPSAAEADWLLSAAIEQAAGSSDLFGAVRDSPGLRRRIARTIQELQTARCGPRKLRPLCEARVERVLAEIYALYTRFLRSSGLVSPAERLALAAQEAAMHGFGCVKQIDFDGFGPLSLGERDLMQSLATHEVSVRIMLAEEPAVGLFPRMERRTLDAVRRPKVEPRVVRAANPQQEIEEIARRILAIRRTTNAPFHHFGVILRSPSTYASTIQSVFEGMGLPLQMRRNQTLAEHRVGRFARKLLGAIVDGFPAERTLQALRMTASVVGTAEGADRWDFRVRERLPADGLEALRADAPPVALEALDRLAVAEAWRMERATAVEWSRRCQSLFSKLISHPTVSDGLGAARVLDLRAFAEAARMLTKAFDETARLVGSGGSEKIRLSRFVTVFENVALLMPLAVSDARRNVVQVLSAQEASQWELPHVFIAGLAEGWFPRPVELDLLLSDSARLRLRQAGVEIRLQADSVAEERRLFENAQARATQSLTLSYPLTDASGAPLVRSFLLESGPSQDGPATGAKAARPTAELAEPVAAIDDPRLRHWIASRYPTFSPSALDRYLQCPYMAFAERTLALLGAPKRPQERLDHLWQGSLLHAAIAAWNASGDSDIAKIFDGLFASGLTERNVTGDFATELLQAAMRRDLENFARHPAARSWGDRSAHETGVRFVVDADEGYEVKGRIDRYDVIDGDAVLVVDYKSSGGSGIAKLADKYDRDQAVQLLLYLSGLARGGRRAAGAVLWGLRGDAGPVGWMEESAHQILKPGKSVVALAQADLNERIGRAEAVAGEAVRQLRSGCIEADPIDVDHCEKYCDFRDLCRIEL